jgi:hypothetical protein
MADAFRITHQDGQVRSSGSTDTRLAQLAWFAAVAFVAFLVPLVFSSTLDLQHDVYYFVYFAITCSVLGLYVRANDIDLMQVFTRNWKLSLAVGAASAVFVVWSVLGRLDLTPHPSGAYFAFEILWRGAFYGVVDALLLSAFPGLVAYELMNRDLSGLSRRIAYGAITLALVMVITATYHYGYKDLQNTRGISQPEIGNTIISLPVIVSANPLGSIVAHTSMHLAAVTHSYESKDRLPPQTFVD